MRGLHGLLLIGALIVAPLFQSSDELPLLPAAKQVDTLPDSPQLTIRPANLLMTPVPAEYQDGEGIPGEDEELFNYKPDWANNLATKDDLDNMFKKIELLVSSKMVSDGPVGKGEELHPDEKSVVEKAEKEAEKIPGVNGNWVEHRYQVGTKTETYTAMKTEPRTVQQCNANGTCTYRTFYVQVPVQATRQVPQYETKRVWVPIEKPDTKVEILQPAPQQINDYAFYDGGFYGWAGDAIAFTMPATYANAFIGAGMYDDGLVWATADHGEYMKTSSARPGVMKRAGNLIQRFGQRLGNFSIARAEARAQRKAERR